MWYDWKNFEYNESPLSYFVKCVYYYYVGCNVLGMSL